MCTIGWLKLKDSFIIFKNADNLASLGGKRFVMQEKGVFGFGDDNFEGMWAGMNKYFGIVLSYGPSRGTKDPFYIIEQVLRECNSIDKAVKKFIEVYRKDEADRSLNVIIGNNKKAVSIELAPKESSTREFKGVIIKTNHFTEMVKYNPAKKDLEASKIRLKKAIELTRNVKKAEDLKPILGYHSKENPYESICRHGFIKNIGSAIFEVKGDKVKVLYSLNRYAHNQNYKVKRFGW